MPKIVLLLFLVTLLSAPAGRAVDFPTIPGWKLMGKAMSYDTRTIWKAINGAAETYLAYGFQNLTVQDYQKGDVQISLYVYDQSLPINAWGIFHKERAPGAKQLVAGTMAAYAKPYQCVLLKAHHYVKAEASKGKLTRKICETLLISLAKSLSGKADLPEELERLPLKNRLAGSLGYARRSYLGLGELTNCLHAKYQAPGREEPFLVFTIIPDAGSNTDQIWKKLSGKWKTTKLGKLPVVHREIPYRGPIAIARTSAGLLGITDSGDLKTTLAALEKLTRDSQ